MAGNENLHCSWCDLFGAEDLSVLEFYKDLKAYWIKGICVNEAYSCWVVAYICGTLGVASFVVVQSALSPCTQVVDTPSLGRGVFT